MDDRNLIDLLIADHERIRDLIQDTQELLELEPIDASALMTSFKSLRAAFLAHAKAEEIALYSLFEDVESEKMEELKAMSLEGFEEHSLVDLLFREMSRSRKPSDSWKAKFEVVSELLEHHLDEEEEEFFPMAEAALEEEELLALGELYLERREAMIGKGRPKDVTRAMNLQ